MIAYLDAPTAIGAVSAQMNNWQHRVAPDDLPPMAHKDHGEPVGVWRYNDTEGRCIGYVAKYRKTDGGEERKPWTYGAYSEHVKADWAARSWANGQKPLYGLDLLAQNPDKKVCIVQNEGAADAVRVLLGGMVGTTWPGDAKSIADVDWSPLAGRNVLLIPDADKAGIGEQTMLTVARYLLALGCTPVRIADISDMPDRWNVADAVAEGWTAQRFADWIKPLITTLTSQEIEKRAAPQRVPLVLAAKPAVELAVESAKIKPPKIKPHTQIKESLSAVAPEFSDVHIAEVWADNDGKDWLYCHGWECWMRWDESRWAIDRRKSVTRLVADQMKTAAGWMEANQLSSKDRRALCSVAKISSVLRHAATLPTIARLPADFDSDPFLLGTPGGTLDLRTGVIREPRREDYITRQTAVTPKAGPMPQWDKVLDRCTMGDADMRKYYQRWAGYILTGDCREEAFLFVHGAGNSGKSKFIDCLGDILGRAEDGGYCATAKIEMLMESKIERHTEEIASLAGARMVRSSEPDEGARWNEALLKLITGRDTISARRLYEKQFTFRPEFKLLVNGNFRPAFKSTGEEIFRRMHFVEFPDSIPEHERIYNLPELLRAEWPAILAWMVEGCIEWQRMGLARPEKVKSETREYLCDEDTLGRWIEECCTVGTGLKTPASEAYKSYRAYVEKVGEGVVSQKRFSQRMEARGFGKSRTTAARYITGIALGIESVGMGEYDEEF